VGALLTLLFQTINFALPDPLVNSGRYVFSGYSGAIRWSIASLIIIFPIYLLLSWLLLKDLKGIPEKAGIWVRRWLLLLTLFIAGAAIAADLVVLINSFLGGLDVTLRFVLKVISVLIVSALVFCYYIWDLRREPFVPTKAPKVSAAVAAVIVTASIVYAFTVIGSPLKARQARFDEQRSSDLGSIQGQIVNYWQRKGELPAALADLEDPISGFHAPNDPESGNVYEYIKKSEKTFELCATFNLPRQTESKTKAIPSVSPVYYGDYSNFYDHFAGRVCFEKEIDPDLYPVLKDQIRKF
jgi:hypothetical protein